MVQLEERPTRQVGRFYLNKTPAGFTLIELLVVIVIIGLMAGIVTFSVGDNFHRQLRQEAERFQTVLLAAADEAVYKSAEIGIYFTPTSYVPLRYDKVARGWVLMTDRPFQMYSLPDGMRLEYRVEGFTQTGEQYEEVELFVDEEKPEESALEEIRNTLEASGIDLEAAGSLAETIQLETVELVPQIYILSSGEQSVFTLDFAPEYDEASLSGFRVISDGFSMPRVIDSAAVGGENIAAGF